MRPNHTLDNTSFQNNTYFRTDETDNAIRIFCAYDWVLVYLCLSRGASQQDLPASLVALPHDTEDQRHFATARTWDQPRK